MNSEDLQIHTLQAISPIDGRHHIFTKPLSQFFSEFALHRFRVFVEVEYLIALSQTPAFIQLRQFTPQEKEFLRSIFSSFSLNDAIHIQNIDHFGTSTISATHHDVKAVEYFIKEKIQTSTLKDIEEFVHFGLTSEDVNNIAHNLMIREGLRTFFIPELVNILDSLSILSLQEKESIMLAKTHGQPAVPTTFGKEVANFLERLRKDLTRLTEYKLPAKLNGAVGTFAAMQYSAAPVDWIAFSENFITSLGFSPNLLTTQIEPHDGIVELCSIILSINNIICDLCIDLWMYISQGLLVQKNITSEIGSSTMPQKINPWRLEVAEGSTREANAKLIGFMNKIQMSRLQRDLSDHEALRGIGEAIAHSFVALTHLGQEIGRITPNRTLMKDEVYSNAVILSEAIQSVLRVEGYPKPYEMVKDLSKGKMYTLEELQQHITQLPITTETKRRLTNLSFESYLGLCTRLVDIALERWNNFREKYHSPNVPITTIILNFPHCFKATTNSQNNVPDSINNDLPELKIIEMLEKRGLEIRGIDVPYWLQKRFSKVYTSQEVNQIIIDKNQTAIIVGKNTDQDQNVFNQSNQNTAIKYVALQEPLAQTPYHINQLSELIPLVEYFSQVNIPFTAVTNISSTEKN
ncbi:adenylosuccinate lyase [Candidatus Woesearchaeota archaeon]|nr:adenylosuccinate lyase [Candidatus Woesearchaeota archaeon]